MNPRENNESATTRPDPNDVENSRVASESGSEPDSGSDSGSDSESSLVSSAPELPIADQKADVLTGDEKIPWLLMLLFPSAVRAVIASIPQWIRFKLIAFFGICSMIAPLALWLAPSMKIWLSILGGSLLSIFFCWALVWFGPEDHY